jgi:nucleoid-associated protein YgaU
VGLDVTADKRAFASTKIADDGTWSVSGTVDLEKARREMRFILRDADGAEIASYELPVASRDLSKGFDGSQMIVVQRGDALWRIAFKNYGEGIKYVDIVRRNAAAIGDPDLIYPNQIFALPD